MRDPFAMAENEEVVILVNDGNPKKLYLAFINAASALAFERRVFMFFSMDGLRAVKKTESGKLDLPGEKPFEEYYDLVAQDKNAQVVACEFSMRAMGVRQDELKDGVNVGGTAQCFGEIFNSKAVLSF